MEIDVYTYSDYIGPDDPYGSWSCDCESDEKPHKANRNDDLLCNLSERRVAPTLRSIEQQKAIRPGTLSKLLVKAVEPLLQVHLSAAQ